MKTQIKKHKALFILPLGLLPFVILIFYILGGGSGASNEATITKQGGANYQLPDANRDITILDKQEAYRQIKEEEPREPVSLNVDTTQTLTPLELTENTPSVDVNKVLLAHVKKQEQLSRQALQKQVQSSQSGRATDKQKQLARTDQPGSVSSINERAKRQAEHGTPTPQVRTAQKTTIELEELSELVDEHERLIRQNDSLSKQLHKAQLTNQRKLLQPETSFKVRLKASIGFEQTAPRTTSIKAQVAEDTKVLSGNRVILRLICDTQVNGMTISKGTLVYGLCKTDNERLQLLITSLPYQDSFLPVKLSAYDLDGIKGLYVPDNVNRKVYKDVAGDVNPSVLFTPGDNPLSYMGINAAADLGQTMVKRVKLKRIYLRKNTVLILKNDQ
ncbi:MAG: conjugative transposon protein TraM [Carboxylicivirga sp.]|jgi:conjugative transposon TraM protein|nr:conjugative transposon protein TraM [Carboxylicivirga sp.]